MFSWEPRGKERTLLSEKGSERIKGDSAFNYTTRKTRSHDFKENVKEVRNALKGRGEA